MILHKIVYAKNVALHWIMMLNDLETVREKKLDISTIFRLNLIFENKFYLTSKNATPIIFLFAICCGKSFISKRVTIYRETFVL